MSAIRIALVDDQALVREGLKALLRSLGIDVALEAADGATALDALRTLSVDVIVADIRMPGMSGLEMVSGLRERGDRTPAILLTTFDDSALMLQATQAGAQGFLLKDAEPEDLYEAIVRAARGDSLLQPVATELVRQRFAYREQSPPKAHFTEREAAILRLLAGGYTNREIAASLFLAEGTIKNYVSDILDKLGARDRTRAVLKAITLRII